MSKKSTPGVVLLFSHFTENSTQTLTFSSLTIETHALLVKNMLLTLIVKVLSQSFSSVSSKLPWNTHLRKERGK